MSLLPLLAALSLVLLASIATGDVGAASATALPAAVDLRPRFSGWGLETRPQGSRPTCSVFTVTGALEYAAASRTGRGTPYSVEFLNWAAHQTTGHPGDGGFFSEIWSGFQAHGVCPEAALPYRVGLDSALQPDAATRTAAGAAKDLGLALHWIKEWNPRTGLSPEQMAGVKRTLVAGWPVCGGFRWPKEPQWDSGVLRMCGPRAVYDGHSVLLAGYRDDPEQPGGGVFLIRNSSGPSREGALSYAYVQAYMNDAAWVEAPQ